MSIPISICVIMKDEEKNLDQFLQLIENKFEGEYEIILVDTGSSDKSKEIAKAHNVSLYDFQWVDDFSAARNFSISKAKYDWILVLDCDEYITDIEIDGLYRMVQQDPKGVGILTRRNVYMTNGIAGSYTDGVERFFDKRLYHYEAIIHEQVRPIDKDMEMSRTRIPLSVDHSGYEGEANLKVKAERNRALLLKMLENAPDDPYLYFQIGQCYQGEKNSEQAAYYFGKGLEYDVDPRVKYVQLMVVGYGYALLDLGREEEALAFESIHEAFCNYADFLTLMGLIYLRTGYINAAINEFEQAMKIEEADTAGANSYIPAYNLGCMYEVMGDINKAKDYYKMCGEFPPAVDRLKQL